MERRTTYIDSKENQSSLVHSSQTEITALKAEIEKLKQQITLLETKLTISEQQDSEKIELPISLFQTSLSSLEAVVRYLKEHMRLRFSEIAQLLGRDDRTIWHAYKRAMNKGISPAITKSAITIPVSIFLDRKYAPLEVVVAHLKEQYHLSFQEIGKYLARSPKTIWTVYSRWRKKNAS